MQMKATKPGQAIAVLCIYHEGEGAMFPHVLQALHLTTLYTASRDEASSIVSHLALVTQQVPPSYLSKRAVNC